MKLISKWNKKTKFWLSFTSPELLFFGIFIFLISLHGNFFLKRTTIHFFCGAVLAFLDCGISLSLYTYLSFFLCFFFFFCFFADNTLAALILPLIDVGVSLSRSFTYLSLSLSSLFCCSTRPWRLGPRCFWLWSLFLSLVCLYISLFSLSFFSQDDTLAAWSSLFLTVNLFCQDYRWINGAGACL
jgi:hypothetical protein